MNLPPGWHQVDDNPSANRFERAVGNYLLSVYDSGRVEVGMTVWWKYHVERGPHQISPAGARPIVGLIQAIAAVEELARELGCPI
jgi:hypothetical protein